MKMHICGRCYHARVFYFILLPQTPSFVERAARERDEALAQITGRGHTVAGYRIVKDEPDQVEEALEELF